MKKILVSVVKRFFPKIYIHFHAYRMLILNEHSYLHCTGWIKSLENGKPVDRNGSEVPWMNYPVVSFLSERMKAHMSVFEYGSGYSTIFYSRHVKSVTSVEYNEKWFSIVGKMCPENVELLYQAEDVNGLYCRKIQSSGERYDIIVIDGRDRVNCILQSLETLSANGVVVLDDAQRDEYQVGVQHLVSSGFSRLRFEGLKATGFKSVETSIFYRANNCFGI